MREILIVDDNPSNLDLLARLLRDAGCKVRAVTGGRLPASPVQVVADVRFLKEILDNLIANAVKFSPPGRQVTVSCASESGWIHCSVADQGPGFTEEDRKRLYARFVRLSASPTAGEKSTGLGLSIVKQMIDAMNGEVRVDSELARGSVFHVQLPCGMGQLT